MGNLYGFLGPVGSNELVLISLNADLQHSLGEIFGVYEEQFLNGIDEAIGFDGGYSPDSNQLVQMPLIQEMADLVGQIDLGAIGRDRYDPRARAPEDLRALAWAIDEGPDRRVLIQNFTRAQALSRKTILNFDGETFSRLDEPTLLISNKIDAIISNGVIRFKKFNVLRQIFDMFEVYREATDQDIVEFSNIENIHIEDLDTFTRAANKTARKLIFSVSRSGILDNRTADEIRDMAQTVDINLQIDNGRIVMPRGSELTNVLRFLDNSIYRSPVTNERWMANSRRKLG